MRRLGPMRFGPFMGFFDSASPGVPGPRSPVPGTRSPVPGPRSPVPALNCLAPTPRLLRCRHGQAMRNPTCPPCTLPTQVELLPPSIVAYKYRRPPSRRKAGGGGDDSGWGLFITFATPVGRAATRRARAAAVLAVAARCAEGLPAAGHEHARRTMTAPPPPTPHPHPTLPPTPPPSPHPPRLLSSAAGVPRAMPPAGAVSEHLQVGESVPPRPAVERAPGLLARPSGPWVCGCHLPPVPSPTHAGPAANAPHKCAAPLVRAHHRAPHCAGWGQCVPGHAGGWAGAGFGAGTESGASA